MKDAKNSIKIVREKMSERKIDLPTACLKARVLISEGDHEGGLRLLNHVIEYDPEYGMAYVNRGTLYSVLKKYDFALRDLKKAVALGYQHAVIYSTIATILYQLEKYELALKYFAKAVQLDPKNSLSYINRANLYQDMKEYPLAIKDFEMCLMLGIDDNSRKQISDRLEVLRSL